MIFLVIIVIVIIVSIQWNQEQNSRAHVDWIMRNDPEFRDTPGNKYYRPPGPKGPNDNFFA